MQRLPQEELRTALSLTKNNGGIDNQTAIRLKKKLAEEFRDQLTFGVPTNEDETGLRRLAVQIKAKKLVVKLFLRHPLHAKLYLLFRSDPITPSVGYLGSSNLTLAGLSQQGELNVDVLDHDACQKLARWFEDRWKDQWCVDISEELLTIIQESWAREEPIPPYHFTSRWPITCPRKRGRGFPNFASRKSSATSFLSFRKLPSRLPHGI
ncbi:MAG TPA: phospholipase D-like domain-containing protein [Nitrospiraceae bacterium]|nr:phospholipase D-like domain-containing protein [Nitrospiraceae bacterium]